MICDSSHRFNSLDQLAIPSERINTATMEAAVAQAKLPGPLKVLDANAPLVPSVTKGEMVYRDRNVICVSLPPKLGYGK